MLNSNDAVLTSACDPESSDWTRAGAPKADRMETTEERRRQVIKRKNAGRDTSVKVMKDLEHLLLI